MQYYNSWHMKDQDYSCADAIKMELLEDSQGEIQATLYEILVSM